MNARSHFIPIFDSVALRTLCPYVIRVRWSSKISRKLASGSSCTWLTFHSPDSPIKSRSAFDPSQSDDGRSIALRFAALRSAMVPLSIIPRSLSGPGGSLTSSQSSGIAPMCSLTASSRGYSVLRTWLGALDPFAHEARIESGHLPEASSEVPTCRRNTDPRWFPPPGMAPPRVPLCCDRRFHSVVFEFRKA